jgi:exosortase/archaeosortase family protein
MLHKSFYKFLLIFAVTFLCCYYGFQITSGAAVEGGLYSPFIQHYFNIASWIRQGLMFSTHNILNLFGFSSVIESEFILRASNKAAIKLVYGCLGIAVYSFWIAYIFATITTYLKKTIWFLSGLLTLWIINVARISLVLVSLKNNWSFPFGIDQHTWFNIVAYFFIFLLIYFFEKSIKIKTKQS